MKASVSENGPVVIGGIGGSGTRVVAEILALFGFYLGSDLNSASDNLTYTLLFKRPEWFKKNINNTRRLVTGLRIMEKSLLTGEPLSFRQKIFLRKAVLDMSKHGHNREKSGTGEWPLERLAHIKATVKLDEGRYRGWGWKEPNCHLALPVLGEYFPHLRYIHTVRHGLDMAFSSNQQQLYNWAPLFGIKLPETPLEIPAASFRYWVEANRRVLSAGNQLGSEKFLLVNFDELCTNPLPGVIKIAEFLQIRLPDELISEASKLLVMPNSTGRYKEHPEYKFDSKDLSFLKEAGFRN